MHEPITDLSYFQMLVADADNIPLLEAAAAIGQDEYPGLDLHEVLSDVDILTQRLADRCRECSTEISRLQTVLSFFYKERGFSGNVNDYYTPDNSFIHKLLETRRGIPISLGVLLVELTRHVGLDAHGISFPGHFLVGVNLHQGAVILDPFSGESLSNEALLERLEPFRGPLGLASRGQLPVQQFLQPASAKDILLRMLHNLREIHSHHGEQGKLERVVARIEVLDPSA